eukprot:SAG11_NODE_6521_length_1296_cov_2.232247_2_plen_117_part_00
MCLLVLATVAMGMLVAPTDAVHRGCECIDRSDPDNGQTKDVDLCPGQQIGKPGSRISSPEDCCEYCRKETPTAINWVWAPNDGGSENCWCKETCSVKPVAVSASTGVLQTASVAEL